MTTYIITPSLVGQKVQNPPAMWETWVRSLGWEDPLEEDKVMHFSILAKRIHMDRGAWWATVNGDTKSQIRLSTAQYILSYVEFSQNQNLHSQDFEYKWFIGEMIPQISNDGQLTKEGKGDQKVHY